MPRLIPYTQQTTVSGELGGRRATAEDFGIGDSLIQAGKEIGNVAVYLKEQETRRELDAVQEAMSQARIDQMGYYDQRKKEHQPGDMSFADTTRKELSNYFTQMEGQYKSREAKHYIRTHGAQMTATFFGDAMGFQAKKAGEYSANMYHIRKENDGTAVFNDDRLYDQTKASGTSDILNRAGKFSGLSKESVEKEANEYTQYLANNAAQGWLNKPGNRGALVSQMKGGETITPEATFDNSLPGIYRREGGYKADDAGKGAVNLGILQSTYSGYLKKKGLPDADVKNITKDMANRIYKEEFWDRFGIETLPQNVQKIVFDGTINHSNAFSKKLVEAAQSGASPVALVEMRKAEYDRLKASGKKEYVDSHKGWMNRLEDLKGEAASFEKVIAEPLSIDESKLPAWYSDLAPEAKDRFLREAITKQKQENALLKGNLEQKVKDSKATIAVGKDPGAIPMSEFVGAYGSEGARKYTEYELTRTIVPWSQSLHKKSNAEIMSILGSEKDRVGGDGAFAELSLLKMKQDIAKEVLEKRKSDPANYVLENSDSVKDFLNNAESVIRMPNADVNAKRIAVNDYVNAITAEQKRLGLQPDIITKEMRQGILQRYTQARGEDVAAFMRNEAAVWGQHWPQVVREMGKDLPPTAIVLGQAPSVADDAQAILSEANRMKESEWKAGVEKDVITKIDNDLNNKMSQFGRMLSLQEGGAQTFSNWRAEAEKLAIGYHKTGMSPSQAVDKAYQKLVSDIWDVKGTYRIPNSSTKSIQHSDIEVGANLKLRDISSLPIAINQAPPGIREEDWKRIELAKIGKDLFWSNMSGDRGLVLYRKIAPGEYARVPSETGGNIEFTWDELSRTALEYKRIPARMQPAKSSMLGAGIKTGFD